MNILGVFWPELMSSESNCCISILVWESFLTCLILNKKRTETGEELWDGDYWRKLLKETAPCNYSDEVICDKSLPSYQTFLLLCFRYKTLGKKETWDWNICFTLHLQMKIQDILLWPGDFSFCSHKSLIIHKTFKIKVSPNSLKQKNFTETFPSVNATGETSKVKILK